ncbi:hypothetical protein PG995_005116 [Apiospora arundinis]|uniref:Uncharacterized protein n=1 Tax=Apiospora arundinis TaxID=335852 RepID=A0ABR2J3G4_9PEZI
MANHNGGKPIPPLPLPLSASITGHGGFLNLDDSPPERVSTRSPRPQYRQYLNSGSRAAGVVGGGSGVSSDGLSEIIQGWDFMDIIIDEHAP